MADKKNRGYYIDGSTVRKLEPQIEPNEPARRGKPKPSVQKKPVNDRRWVDELKYGMFLTLSVLIAVGLCVYVLKISADVRAEKVHIENLQGQLNEQMNVNAEYSSGLDSMTDLDAVYKTATEELGMVYSKPGQIVYYPQNSDDYVVQYKNVPEAN